MANKNTRLALNLAMVVIGMCCMAYASVPLYKLFCAKTGFGGTPLIAKARSDQMTSRVVNVEFDSSVAPNLDWEFKPEQRSVKIHAGENSLAFYKAVNKGETSTGTAIYNVSPEKVGQYFNKVQCFCFSRQTILSGKEAHFPVSFFIDPEFAKDPYMADVDTITLHYTFYKADEEGKAIK